MCVWMCGFDKNFPIETMIRRHLSHSNLKFYRQTVLTRNSHKIINFVLLLFPLKFNSHDHGRSGSGERKEGSSSKKQDDCIIIFDFLLNCLGALGVRSFPYERVNIRARNMNMCECERILCYWRSISNGKLVSFKCQVFSCVI